MTERNRDWVQNITPSTDSISDPATDFRTMQKKVHKTAMEHGFWESERGIPESLALIHSEVSEGLEAYRDGQMTTYYDFIGKPSGFGVELADAVIRIMDLAEYHGYDLAGLILEKDAYNQTRPYKHGKLA